MLVFCAIVCLLGTCVFAVGLGPVAPRGGVVTSKSGTLRMVPPGEFVEFLGPPLLVFYPFSLSSTPVLGPPSFSPPLLVFHF